ncbi:MAG: type I secretion system permease/ATPase [Azospira sp.]|jgi:ATP-binding cassette subfamily C exporter for protease/lipase|nr:type I secretion system permease/ATPase [Azospira sp.]
MKSLTLSANATNRPGAPSGKIRAFFARSELTRTLAGFFPEFRAIAVFSLVVNLLMLTPTIFMLQIFDRVMISQNMLTLIVLALITLFLFSVMAFSEWIRSRLLVRIGVKMDKVLSPRVFHAAFEANLKGQTHVSREALGDLAQVRQFATGNGAFAFFDAPWTPIYILVLCLLSPWLGLIAVCFAALFIGLAIASRQLAQPPQEAASEAARQENRFVQSKLRNTEVIEAMGMLPALRQRWLGRHRNALAGQSLSADVGQRIQSVSKFFRYAQQSLVLGAGALLVIAGDLSIGAMIAANVLMGRALQPIDVIMGSWQSFFKARDAFLRLEGLLAEFPERSGQLTPTDLSPTVRLEHLYARAPGREAPILHDLCAEFPAGSVTAILGPSGSGKSTLARCLLGIWPQTEGAVLLDGEPIQRWDRNELGRQIGYLPQDVELFDGSIAENIARFDTLDPEKVIAASKTAGLHETILRFPKGYDSPIAEAGSALSGGQRQRLALARAIYGDPSLIVLDEPNANLDSEGEAALQQTILALKAAGKTVFLTTHRPQIIGVADNLLVLVQGRIQHHGPRDEVIRALQTPAASA